MQVIYTRIPYPQVRDLGAAPTHEQGTPLETTCQSSRMVAFLSREAQKYRVLTMPGGLGHIRSPMRVDRIGCDARRHGSSSILPGKYFASKSVSLVQRLEGEWTSHLLTKYIFVCIQGRASYVILAEASLLQKRLGMYRGFTINGTCAIICIRKYIIRSHQLEKRMSFLDQPSNDASFVFVDLAITYHVTLHRQPRSQLMVVAIMC